MDRDRRIERRAQTPNDIAKGIGCLVLGGLVTLLGYATADPGDRYRVFWGAMAFGAFVLIRAIGGRQEWW